MSFLKSFWSFAKAHPIGTALLLLGAPLVLGGISLSIYRTAKGALPATIGDKLPTK